MLSGTWHGIANLELVLTVNVRDSKSLGVGKSISPVDFGFLTWPCPYLLYLGEGSIARVAENSVVNRTFCKMDLESLVMHSIWLYFKASQQDAWLWFVERSRAGTTSPEMCDAPCDDTWPKSCPSLSDTSASPKFVSETRQSCISGSGSGVGLRI